jgi:hypothetical protein
MNDYWLSYRDSTMNDPKYIDYDSEQEWRHALYSMARNGVLKHELTFDFVPRHNGGLGAGNTSKKPAATSNK